MREIEQRKWLVTLDNGQVWKQDISKRFRLREGDVVRIFSTRWGSGFRLSAEGRSGYIRISRRR